jgi:hypothetical protein
MMAEPTTWPFCVIRLPPAWNGKTVCAAPVKISGRKKPMAMVKKITRDRAGRISRIMT